VGAQQEWWYGNGSSNESSDGRGWEGLDGDGTSSFWNHVHSNNSIALNISSYSQSLPQEAAPLHAVSSSAITSAVTAASTPTYLRLSRYRPSLFSLFHSSFSCCHTFCADIARPLPSF
jgi:hypothetical protein